MFIIKRVLLYHIKKRREKYARAINVENKNKNEGTGCAAKTVSKKIRVQYFNVTYEYKIGSQLITMLHFRLRLVLLINIHFNLDIFLKSKLFLLFRIFQTTAHVIFY